MKLTNGPLTDQLNLTDRNLPELSNECWQTLHESCSQYHHGWMDQSLSTDVEQHQLSFCLTSVTNNCSFQSYSRLDKPTIRTLKQTIHCHYIVCSIGGQSSSTWTETRGSCQYQDVLSIFPCISQSRHCLRCYLFICSLPGKNKKYFL